jgi:hypothetical protein
MSISGRVSKLIILAVIFTGLGYVCYLSYSEKIHTPYEIFVRVLACFAFPIQWLMAYMYDWTLHMPYSRRNAADDDSVTRRITVAIGLACMGIGVLSLLNYHGFK